MPETHNDTSLLGALKALYHQLVNRIFLMRQKSYRPKSQGASSKELSKRLQEFIKQPPSAGDLDTAADAAQNLSSESVKRVSSETQGAPPGSARPDHGKPVLSEWRHNQGPSDSIGNKLMQSTWEHLHASVRFARLGNAETARLHASIMDSSLKEAAHYLDDEVYSEFVQSLTRELNGLTGMKEKPES